MAGSETVGELRLTLESDGSLVLWVHNYTHDDDGKVDLVAQGRDPEPVMAAAEEALSNMKAEAIRLRGVHP